MYISAVIITKNEERNIERCIKSLLDVVDEIVVVDSFSTDNTKNICLQYDVKFECKEWAGYAEQKNYANSIASNDMILSIDADEELSEELKESILEIKSSNIDNVVFKFKRLNNYCGKWIKHGAWYPDTKIRIFNRKTTYWKDTKVHEILNYGNTKVIMLKGDLLHYPFLTIEEHIATANKYSTLRAQYNFECGKRKTYCSFLLSAISKFIMDFILKGGFLDGYYGFTIYKITVWEKYLQYAKLKELNHM
ncbi:glycosyltransferase family 2 protein [Bacteroidales bacterium OttesenSCG-928-K03]|nr:glycosyltransferase family 2 protein [Odoribacter sp. OttesenSCG-928-L07]MDL2242227.1 glycosyltransferase family 2 protein [Bacteroidales bacterium OttesenSCG-928-K03]